MWENLAGDKYDTQKFCDTCQRSVFRVETKEDLEYHASLGHCVAFKVSRDRSIKKIMGEVPYM